MRAVQASTGDRLHVDTPAGIGEPTGSTISTKLFSNWRSQRSRRRLFAMVPALVFLMALFVYPVFGSVVRSFVGSHGATLEWYHQALTGVSLHVIGTTLLISLETAFGTAVIGFPLAHILSRLRPGFAAGAIAVIIVPQFISAIVRTYAWIILLDTHGLVNNLLVFLRIPGAPFQLLYDNTGVLIGMIYVLLPYSVLVMYAVMRNFDRRLLGASSSLGAGRVVTFRRVYLPSVLPGVVGGCMLTFILALGYYLTPALMGGEGQTVVATLIDETVRQATSSDWSYAMALGVVLLGITLVGMLVLRMLLHLSERGKGRAR